MTTEKKRILVIDDLPADSGLLKQYLEGTDQYVVKEENDSLAAIATAEKFQPQLILMDVMMPGISGGELAATLGANPKLKSVPIVFLTAAITKDEVEAVDGRIAGVPFLAKPIVLSEVAASLKLHLGE
jgi:two-component system OmpR family response regulator